MKYEHLIPSVIVYSAGFLYSWYIKNINAGYGFIGALFATVGCIFLNAINKDANYTEGVKE